ncbi:MAG: fumarylacetoacetate hydrolase family protein [Blastocatellia bacterium]|nr:fumarylacetoacetate hydrolase family protein [Chloracidobacterium sp.]MBL8185018.1 fumarylacetoacetate hydrolase family protein [Blastocatellia bacterium]HBE83233.1 2-hydroxyhepta-2,4-diene-1,7-dioate isomerase [Blastocatellia bacterium]HRJ89473.1 fumarylacetoacetate hydrolase family protein [Pyrinomonadaceae bacterium]HRK50664.1 fumarylacetoacetate hydrolase family protein [Pyrinomonadaceae bacterium]
MKLCRINKNGTLKVGILDGQEVWGCDAELNRTNELAYLDEVELLAPVAPSKIVCVGRNYADHAAELGNAVPASPLLFLKAPSSIIADGQSIVIPESSTQVEHEAELGIVIGHRTSKLGDRGDALKYILGYTCINDVTARDIQRADVQFTRGKSFDTFCPIGPYIETDLDTSDLAVSCMVNGEIKQNGRTSQMIFPVDYLVWYISWQMTLVPGDVIATGTPAGVSRLKDGDMCEVAVEGIGTLRNRVTAAAGQ